MRVRVDEGFFRSINRAPVRVQLALHAHLFGILARGRARIDDERLCSHIIDDWYLYFRFPKAGEEDKYPADARVLMSVERDR